MAQGARRYNLKNLGLRVDQPEFTVFVDEGDGKVVSPKLPTPMFSLALEPKARGEEAKIAEARALHTALRRGE